MTATPDEVELGLQLDYARRALEEKETLLGELRRALAASADEVGARGRQCAALAEVQDELLRRKHAAESAAESALRDKAELAAENARLHVFARDAAARADAASRRAAELRALVDARERADAAAAAGGAGAGAGAGEAPPAAHDGAPPLAAPAAAAATAEPAPAPARASSPAAADGGDGGTGSDGGGDAALDSPLRGEEAAPAGVLAPLARPFVQLGRGFWTTLVGDDGAPSPTAARPSPPSDGDGNARHGRRRRPADDAGDDGAQPGGRSGGEEGEEEAGS
jgi:hypothetical protein